MKKKTKIMQLSIRKEIKKNNIEDFDGLVHPSFQF